MLCRGHHYRPRIPPAQQPVGPLLMTTYPVHPPPSPLLLPPRQFLTEAEASCNEMEKFCGVNAPSASLLAPCTHLPFSILCLPSIPHAASPSWFSSSWAHSPPLMCGHAHGGRTPTTCTSPIAAPVSGPAACALRWAAAHVRVRCWWSAHTAMAWVRPPAPSQFPGELQGSADGRADGAMCGGRRGAARDHTLLPLGLGG